MCAYLFASFKSVFSNNARFGRIMEPEEVASAIVEGFLRNKREVYIPAHGILLPFLIG